MTSGSSFGNGGDMPFGDGESWRFPSGYLSKEIEDDGAAIGDVLKRLLTSGGDCLGTKAEKEE